MTTISRKNNPLATAILALEKISSATDASGPTGHIRVRNDDEKTILEATDNFRCLKITTGMIHPTMEPGLYKVSKNKTDLILTRNPNSDNMRFPDTERTHKNFLIMESDCEYQIASCVSDQPAVYQILINSCSAEGIFKFVNMAFVESWTDIINVAASPVTLKIKRSTKMIKEINATE